MIKVSLRTSKYIYGEIRNSLNLHSKEETRNVTKDTLPVYVCIDDGSFTSGSFPPVGLLYPPTKYVWSHR